MTDYKNITEIEAFALMKAGDEHALTHIYNKYWEGLYASVHNVLKDQQASEDIIQDIFIKLWDKRESLEISISLKAYLFASCRYEVFRQIKAQKVHISLFDRLEERLYAPSAYGSLEHKELLQHINSIVEALPVKCREVYKLSREENLSHKEIAEKLNISTKTVENHMTRALSQLRGSLGGLLTIEVVTWLMKNY